MCQGGDSNAFLSFFGNDDNYNDEEEDNLPVDDHTTVHHTIVAGGPVEPNYSSMMVAAANMAREQYKKELKRYMDRQHHLCLKEMEGFVDVDVTYIGDQSTKL